VQFGDKHALYAALKVCIACTIKATCSNQQQYNRARVIEKGTAIKTRKELLTTSNDEKVVIFHITGLY